MKRFVPLLLAIVVIAELMAAMVVARAVGVLATLILLVLTCIVGFWVVKAVGLGMLQRFFATTARGELPRREIIDGFTLLVAGLLLVIPGFVTAAVGLLLLTPPVRAVVRARVASRAAAGQFGGGVWVNSHLGTRFSRSDVWETSATDVDAVDPEPDHNRGQPPPGLSP